MFLNIFVPPSYKTNNKQTNFFPPCKKIKWSKIENENEIKNHPSIVLKYYLWRFISIAFKIFTRLDILSEARSIGRKIPFDDYLLFDNENLGKERKITFLSLEGRDGRVGRSFIKGWCTLPALEGIERTESASDLAKRSRKSSLRPKLTVDVREDDVCASAS